MSGLPMKLFVIGFIGIGSKIRYRSSYSYNPDITLRLVNAGGVHVLEIQSPSSCQVEEIARDGIYLPSPIIPRGGKSVLPQGGTMDWLIKCNRKGNFKVGTTNGGGR